MEAARLNHRNRGGWKIKHMEVDEEISEEELLKQSIDKRPYVWETAEVVKLIT